MKQAIPRMLAALLVCVVVNSTKAGSSADNVSSNTVAYWPFDEGLELSDASGNGHTLANTAVTFFRSAAVFDASQSSKLVTESQLAFSTYTNLTIECFFCMATNYSSNYGFLLSSAPTYGDPGAFNFYQQSTNVLADFHNTGGAYDQETSVGFYALGTGMWHHAAVVIDSSKTGKDPDRLQLYVDRKRMKIAATNTLNAALYDRLLYIGARGTQNKDYFTGRMDDIRITAAALSTNEFILGRTASTNCIAYWPFNTGNELEDASGNGNALSNQQVVFTNGSALFRSAAASGLASLSPLPFNDFPDMTVEFFFSTTNSSSLYRFLLMSGQTYGMPGSLSCYGEAGNRNLVTDFHDSAMRYDSENTPENTLYDGKWHHVALIVDSSKTGKDADRLQMYVDRVRQNARFTNSLDSVLFNRTLYIGKRGTQASGHFDGRMDDIRITGRVLSTNEFLAATARTAAYGCVAYWPFEEGKELEDASGNGYSLENSRVTFTAGHAVFDKSLSSRLATAAEIPFNDLVDVTVECFVHTAYVPPNYSFITQSGPTYGQPGTFACYLASNRILMSDFTQAAGTYNQERSNAGQITDAAWHHVAYVMERSVSPTDTNNWFRLYVDGVRQINQWALCKQPVFYNNRFYLGARGTQAIDYFTGRLDDVKITGAALAPSEFMTRRTFYEGTLIKVR